MIALTGGGGVNDFVGMVSSGYKDLDGAHFIFKRYSECAGAFFLGGIDVVLDDYNVIIAFNCEVCVIVVFGGNGEASGLPDRQGCSGCSDVKIFAWRRLRRLDRCRQQ